MTSIIIILTYLKYHVFNFILDSQYQDFNVSFKPVKPIKLSYEKIYANNILLALYL